MTAYANAERLGEANAAGRILLAGQHAPVFYHLTAIRSGKAGYGVRIDVDAPRSWLLDRGFDREVTLERENGAQVRMRFQNKLALEDNLAFTLEAQEDVISSMEELSERYPELRLN